MGAMVDEVVARLGAWFERADARTRGVLWILRATFVELGAERAQEAAASLSYYAIFTLFPLLLLLAAFATSFLRSEVVYEAVVQWIGTILPVVEQDLIRESVQSVMRQSASIGLIGLVALLWSASSFFAVLALHINLAFPVARPSNMLRHRLLALLMVLVVFLLFILSLVLSGATSILRSARFLHLFGEASHFAAEPLWRFGSFVLPWVFTFSMFAALYHWVPTHRPVWRATVLGALVATIAWQVAAMVFGWFVSSGLVNYELVYGSLAAFVALLFWIYLSCYIILFGAHLSGAIDVSRRSSKIPDRGRKGA
jgi:membrane protein